MAKFERGTSIKSPKKIVRVKKVRTIEDVKSPHRLDDFRSAPVSVHPVQSRYRPDEGRNPTNDG